MELIYAYTRKQAILDGVLIDVSALAAAAGIRYPVAVTQTVYESCIAVPDACPWQDTTGRAWDVLVMLGWAIYRNRTARSEIVMTVLVQNDQTGPQQVQLKAVCGPGDDCEPVITVMFPDED